MSNQEIENKPILTYKEYEKIINKELEDYKDMINEFRQQYIDFSNVEHFFQVEPLSYIDYCDINGFEREFKDEELKELF